MWLKLLPLVLAFSHVFALSVIHEKASADFRSHFHNQAEFGESIKEWFKNIKNRIFGRPVFPENREILDLNRADLILRVEDPGSFFVDLSQVTFDPDYDWGFHIGRWYFIRRGDRNVNYGEDNFNVWHNYSEENTDDTELDGNSSNGVKPEENDMEDAPETTTLPEDVPSTDTPVEDEVEEQNEETESVFTYVNSAESVPAR